jgi:hypothetical protein
VANAPADVKVEKVLSQPSDPWGGGDGKGRRQTYDEVLFAGDSVTRKAYVPEGLALVDGETVKGWFNNEKGTWTIADPNPPQRAAQNGSGQVQMNAGRDDATGQSIERQTAAKCAAEMAAAIGGQGPIVLANFEEFFKSAHGLIRGETADAETA